MKRRPLPKIRWIVRVAAAFVLGCISRRLRRLRRLPPRIWHGMYPMHSTRYMVQADRLKGYPSRSVVHHSRLAGYPIVRDSDFDVVVEAKDLTWDEIHWACLVDLLRHGDIWSAFFECLFFRPNQPRVNELTFRLLKLAGIRIIVAPHGGDVIYRSRYVSRFDVVSRKQEDYPDWDLTSFGVVSQERVRLFCRHARLVVASDNCLARYLPRRDVMFKYFPIDCEAVRSSDTRDRDPIRIAHAPNHRHVKGTDHLVAAIDRLGKAGIPCELVLVEKKPRDEALRIYAEADIIADQFCDGSFGLFAFEGMALGKPVLTYLDQEHLGDPVFNHPLINANPENLDDVLAVLLQIPELRTRVGRAGRESVERYQSFEAVGEVWDRLYRHVWWGLPLELETTRHFSPERVPRSFTEDPERPEFWPVPVDDLLPRIKEALARRRETRSAQYAGPLRPRQGERNR